MEYLFDEASNYCPYFVVPRYSLFLVCMTFLCAIVSTDVSTITWRKPVKKQTHKREKQAKGKPSKG